MEYDILVNKKYPLTSDFIPSNLVDTHSRSIEGEKTAYGKNKHNIYLDEEAFKEFKRMQFCALEAGFDIEVDSAYRSFNYQQDLLNGYIKECGDAAYTFCALPGTSEHQTGLAVDVCIFRDGHYIDTDINESKGEIRWVHQNAHGYGFILRYPIANDGNKDSINPITGYKYEPWHIRFVGIELAIQLFMEGITLEEYHEKKISPNGVKSL